MGKKQIKLEDKIKRIEEIVNLLDRGELSLDEMLVLYEEAMKLSTECREYLEKAEQKITEINNKTMSLDEAE